MTYLNGLIYTSPHSILLFDSLNIPLSIALKIHVPRINKPKNVYHHSPYFNYELYFLKSEIGLLLFIYDQKRSK